MGKTFYDQYSLLHFAVGILFYFWGFSLHGTLILHTMFELTENTEFGMSLINRYLTFWPGGKNYADSNINQIGDTFFAVIGYLIARQLDNFYKHK